MNLLRASVILFFLLGPGFTFGSEKAKTIDELAKRFDVSSCKACHRKIHKDWEGSLHARSLVGTPRTMATLRTFITDGLMKEWQYSGVKRVEEIKIDHMMLCAKCHLPQLQDATDAVAQEIARAVMDGDEETLKKININCLVCHNTKALIHKWVDGEVDPNAIYGSKEGSHGDPKYKVLKKSPVMNEAILCGQCHGLGPNFDMPNPTQCATLYGSYLHAYIPVGGFETCQDCHMRKNHRGHLMPGYRDPDVAKGAVRVEVDATGYQFLQKAGDLIPEAVITIRMTNHAGHRIPDG